MSPLRTRTTTRFPGRLCLTIAGMALAAATASAQTPGVTDPTSPATETAASSPPESLADRLDALDQELKVLKRKLEIEREEEEVKSRAAPIFSAGKEGFALKSADGAFQLKLRGYLQADGRFFIDDDDPSLADTFLIRRARPIFEGTVFKIFDFRIMPDFGGGTTVLQDGYVDGRFLPELKLRVGKFKTPFGIERLQSATDIRFVERALPNNLVPNRDVGAQLFGDLFGESVSYAAGIFNGVADAGSGDLDDFSEKDFAGRLFALPFKATEIEALEGLGLGVAGTIGNREGTSSLPTYRTPGQAAFFRYSNGVQADGLQYRISPQGHYYWGSFGLLAEYVVSWLEVETDTASDEIMNQAWQVAASYVLTGEKASYKSVEPKAPFDWATGQWGAWEVVGRASWLRVDDEAFPVFANPAQSARRALSLGAGVNWYLNRAVRVALDYEWTTFDPGASGGDDREDERAVFCRFQISF